ncbi:MAG: lysophospholipid acyltransferase family protein [Planctomycetota bacterium]|jgi:1-acyl-sn-glycerol-3-phosphate acyltransferase
MIKELVLRLWYHIARILCAIVICLPYRVRVYGRKNIPETGPVLVLSNHQSFLDPIFGQGMIGRRFLFLARDSLFKNRFFGALLRSISAIPIKRGQSDMATIKKVISELKGGRSVCLYPEGTRTPDGKIADMKPGVALLSRRSGASVVPSVIDGAFECWPRYKKFPSLGKVSVSYGEPIESGKVKELGDEKFAELLTVRLRDMQNELRAKTGRQPFDYSRDTETPTTEVL